MMSDQDDDDFFSVSTTGSFQIKSQKHVFCDKASCWKIKLFNPDVFVMKQIKRFLLAKLSLK